MKKIFLLLLLTFLLLSCNSTKQITEPSFMLANPFVDCSSLEEAENIAGFSISLPRELNNKELIYRVLTTGDKMFEIMYYLDGDKITIRKSKSKEEISGVYKSFDLENTISVNKKDVTIKGNNNLFEVALWHSNNYSYSISSNLGLPLSIIQSYIEQIK